MKKIGYLGPKGTFSQEAMIEYVKGREGFLECSYNTMPDLIYAVNNDEIDEAIVPIENSLEGAVSVTLDMLATDVDLKIKAEIVIAVNQNFMVRKGTKIEDIKYILSHPQPIGQCRKYLNSKFPDALIKYVYSTAEAAREVAEGNKDMGAVGSVTAAHAYDMEIVDRSIQDNFNNLTRFVIVSKEDAEKKSKNKTSIVFSTDNRPGSLYKILDIFSLWDINMTRIESRPAKNKLGKYIFFVDLNGHVEEEDLKDSLTMVKRKTSFYKFLGSYPEYSIK
ncbi:prephenate dehydratase [Herbivorax sp. ANBcel31]|uniref:prephenate dehydratase n=1 Tax=Herbivorax sp. ANBcel31 TaxID=3069754 RepID=UPI0027B7B189|nr:prephenate dehydratase [Herbivorax sp. ANBcel31]MDQ2085120.1 prephenate dehydratase [Herbivorax sp. ANBcel31]